MLERCPVWRARGKIPVVLLAPSEVDLYRTVKFFIAECEAAVNQHL